MRQTNRCDNIVVDLFFGIYTIIYKHTEQYIPHRNLTHSAPLKTVIVVYTSGTQFLFNLGIKILDSHYSEISGE